MSSASWTITVLDGSAPIITSQATLNVLSVHFFFRTSCKIWFCSFFASMPKDGLHITISNNIPLLKPHDNNICLHFLNKIIIKVSKNLLSWIEIKNDDIQLNTSGNIICLPTSALRPCLHHQLGLSLIKWPSLNLTKSALQSYCMYRLLWTHNILLHFCHYPNDQCPRLWLKRHVIDCFMLCVSSKVKHQSS